METDEERDLGIFYHIRFEAQLSVCEDSEQSEVSFRNGQKKL